MWMARLWSPSQASTPEPRSAAHTHAMPRRDDAPRGSYAIPCGAISQISDDHRFLTQSHQDLGLQGFEVFRQSARILEHHQRVRREHAHDLPVDRAVHSSGHPPATPLRPLPHLWGRHSHPTLPMLDEHTPLSRQGAVIMRYNRHALFAREPRPHDSPHTHVACKVRTTYSGHLVPHTAHSKQQRQPNGCDTNVQRNGVVHLRRQVPPP